MARSDAAAVVRVTVEYVDHRLGLWCRPCALSTGARLWFTTRIVGKPTVLHSNVFCTECGSRDVHDDTDRADGTGA